MTDRLGNLGIARVLRQPRRGLRDLLAGDAPLGELCCGEHLSQQHLALVLLPLRCGTIDIEQMPSAAARSRLSAMSDCTGWQTGSAALPLPALVN